MQTVQLVGDAPIGINALRENIRFLIRVFGQSPLIEILCSFLLPQSAKRGFATGFNSRLRNCKARVLV